jgi:hypothetical protein
MSEAVKGQTQDIAIFKGLPNTFLQKSAEIPLLILAAGKDRADSKVKCNTRVSMGEC